MHTVFTFVATQYRKKSFLFFTELDPVSAIFAVQIRGILYSRFAAGCTADIATSKHTYVGDVQFCHHIYVVLRVIFVSAHIHMRNTQQETNTSPVESELRVTRLVVQVSGLWL